MCDAVNALQQKGRLNSDARHCNYNHAPARYTSDLGGRVVFTSKCTDQLNLLIFKV
jgi:hypothetical protein